MSGFMEIRLRELLSSKSEFLQWYKNRQKKRFEPVYILYQDGASSNCIGRTISGEYHNLDASDLYSSPPILEMHDSDGLISALDIVLDGLITLLAQTSLPLPRPGMNVCDPGTSAIIPHYFSDNCSNRMILHRLQSKSHWFFDSQLCFTPTKNIEYQVSNNSKLTGLWVDEQYFDLSRLKQIYYLDEPHNPDVSESECLQNASPASVAQAVSSLAALVAAVAVPPKDEKLIINDAEEVKSCGTGEAQVRALESSQALETTDVVEDVAESGDVAETSILGDLGDFGQLGDLPGMLPIARRTTDVMSGGSDAFARELEDSGGKGSGGPDYEKLRMELKMQCEAFRHLSEAYQLIQEKNLKLGEQVKRLQNEVENSRISGGSGGSGGSGLSKLSTGTRGTAGTRTGTAGTASDEIDASKNGRQNRSVSNTSEENHLNSLESDWSHIDYTSNDNINDANEEIVELKQELQRAQKENQRNKEEIKGLKLIQGQYNLLAKEDSEREKEMQNLRKEYMLRNPNSFTIDNVFPSTEEILSQFQNINNKSHRDCSALILKQVRNVINNSNKLIENKADRVKFNKKYYSQVTHGLLFSVMIKTYNLLKKEKNNIYDSIARLLKTSTANLDDLPQFINSSSDSNANENTNENEKISKANDALMVETEHKKSENAADEECGLDTYQRSEKETEMLEYLFHKYLMNHHKTMLNGNESSSSKMERNGIKHGVIDMVVQEYFGENCIYDDFNPVWVQFEEEMKQKCIEKFEVYVDSCCQVCWIMLLHVPELEIYPHKFWFESGAKYDEEYHKRIFGSDKNCDELLYVKYPTIKRQDEVLSLKMDVITAAKHFEN